MGSEQLAGVGFVVVGGIDGIGRSVVLGAARRGATVLFSGPPRAEAAAEEVTACARSAGVAEKISYVTADCILQAEVDRLFDEASERLPALNVLVVNLLGSAAELPAKPLIETSLAEWDEGLAAHLRQAFLVTQRAVEEFIVGGEGGRIVYVTAAESTTPTPVCLVASRTALLSFMRSVAKEYGRKGIACNLVSIQAGDNNMGNAAETVLFLASQEASFVDGEAVEVEP